jgi:hypothetical protein
MSRPFAGPFAPASLRLRLDHPVAPGHNRPDAPVGGHPGARPAAPPAHTHRAALGVGLVALALAVVAAVALMARKAE